MKKRERGKGKKAGWIYSAVCVGMLLAVGTGWLFLESRCKEIEKQTQEIDAGAVLQKEERKEVLKRRQTLLEEKEEAEAKTRQEKQQIEEEVRAPLEMAAMEELIQNRIAERTALGEKWNVYVKQLSSGSFAVVGAEKQKAASLIKLYIMGTVYEQYDNLAAQYGAAELDRLLTAMITVSDNDAANELTRMLGGGEETAGMEQVNVYCQEKGYKDSSMGRMLLADSTLGENYTSAEDCGNFLFDVCKERHPHADQMLNLLKQQQRIGKIPAGIPEGVETGNKTGELADVENDAAIVWAGETPYILCVMADQLTDTQAAREKIVALSSEIYSQIKEGE